MSLSLSLYLFLQCLHAVSLSRAQSDADRSADAAVFVPSVAVQGVSLYEK